MNPKTRIFWLLQTFEDIPAHNDWLSITEKSVLEKLRFIKRRNDWRLGRWTAKFLIQRYLENQQESFLNSDISIIAAESGAPMVYLKANQAPFTISITHSNLLASCALETNQTAMGCDLEFIESRSDIFLNDYFTSQEMSFLQNLPAHEKDIKANLIWSAKESVLKALKTGLRIDTRKITIHLDDYNPQKWFHFKAQYKEEMFWGQAQMIQGFVFTIVNSLPFDAYQLNSESGWK